MVIIDTTHMATETLHEPEPEPAQFPVLDENMAREVQEKGPIDEHRRKDMDLLVRGCRAQAQPAAEVESIVVGANACDH